MINFQNKETKPNHADAGFCFTWVTHPEQKHGRTTTAPARWPCGNRWELVSLVCYISPNWITFSRKVYFVPEISSAVPHLLVYYIYQIEIWTITGITNRILTQAMASISYFCCGICLVTGCNFLLPTTCRVSRRIQPSTRATRSSFHTFAIC